MVESVNISNKSISIDHLEYIYFIGVGGIGMSALARYFNQLNKKVYGYDKTKTALTKLLVEEGIEVHYEESADFIPEEIKKEVEKSLVIYTPAIPENHAELNFLVKNGFYVLKRSEALGIITKNTHSLAVAGTHGKTTTSSILAHILIENHTPISAFLGGISSNLNSNFHHSEGAEISVVEADEFDRSFLTLYPKGAIITSTDADHLDIYGEKSELDNSFMEFSRQVSEKLIVNEHCLNTADHSSIISYGKSDKNLYQLVDRKVENGEIYLTLKTRKKTYSEVNFSMPGEHNALNALAAVALAAEMGHDELKLIRSLGTFKGIRRRFEFIIRSEKHTYIDDYAHHPEELKASITAAKELFPTEKLVGIFQPHLFSRTKDFAEGFRQSLSLLDELILLDIYPAREKPIPGVSSEWLLEGVATQKQLLTKEETISWVKTNKPKFLMTLGAGDIDQLVESIKNCLS